MKLAIVVAMAENGVIGRGGQLPWRLSADLARFKEITMGHTIVMGRTTYESIGRPLPGRRSVVISSQPDYHPDGVLVARSLADALRISVDEDEVFVIGGAQIFGEALPIADRLYVTRVHAQVEGDVFFPNIDTRQWQLAAESHRAADERNEHPFSFLVYDRVRLPPHQHGN